MIFFNYDKMKRQLTFMFLPDEKRIETNNNNISIKYR